MTFKELITAITTIRALCLRILKERGNGMLFDAEKSVKASAKDVMLDGTWDIESRPDLIDTMLTNYDGDEEVIIHYDLYKFIEMKAEICANCFHELEDNEIVIITPLHYVYPCKCCNMFIWENVPIIQGLGDDYE